MLLWRLRLRQLLVYHFKLAVIIGTLLAVASVVGYTWFTQKYANAEGPLRAEKNIYIPGGYGAKQIGNLLHKEGVILYPKLFPFVYDFYKEEEYLKAGEYSFEPKITPREAMLKINKRDALFRKITIPEGWSSTQILQRLAETPGLTGELPETIDQATVLPDTYLFSFNDPYESVVKRMKDAHKQLLKDHWTDRAGDLGYITNQKSALILASIVQKESYKASEMPKIASVFINRLKRGMRLQSDPTIIYGITGGKHNLGRRLTSKDMKSDTPYNTYLYGGLPPAPICHPGKGAILAVLNPADTDYLYFVADGKDGHIFAKTYQEHKRNVKTYWKERKAREAQTSDSN